MKVDVYKIEIMVIDFDGLGSDEIKSVIENTHYPNMCISPAVKKMGITSVDWSDDHPLNITKSADAYYKTMAFKEPTK